MASEPDPSDQALVEQALAGSQEAYHALVRRYERPLMGLVLRMVRDRPTAEDLVQEAFVKAFRHLRRFDPSRKLSSWLFKIAHNTAIDHLRRRRPDFVPLADEVDEEQPGAVLAAPETRAPDEQVLGRGLAGVLEGALGDLRPAYREVLVLRFQEGLAYQEIAEVTGLALNTVKVHLHRARKHLARALGERGWTLPEEMG